MTREHRCDMTCRCPIHHSSLLYSPSEGDHACQRTDCVYTHGMKSRQWCPMFGRQGMRERFNAILKQKMADTWGFRFILDPHVAEQTAYINAFRECGLNLALSGDFLDENYEVVGSWDWMPKLTQDRAVEQSVIDRDCRVPPLDVTTSGYLTPETVRKAMVECGLWPSPKKGDNHD